jgi:hypothetical protein
MSHDIRSLIGLHIPAATLRSMHDTEDSHRADRLVDFV